MQLRAGPDGQSGKRRENDKKLEQLAFHIEPVFSALQRASRLRVVLLEEFELYQQKAVEADHVIDLVDWNGQYSAFFSSHPADNMVIYGQE